MNDEIKKILDDLLFTTTLPNVSIKLNKEKLNQLRDYITNLQQELEEYKDTETYSKKFLYKANKDRLNANLKLVEENERLKEKNNELEEAQKNAVECIKRSIKDSQLIFGWNVIQRYHDYEMNELLNILDVRSDK